MRVHIVRAYAHNLTSSEKELDGDNVVCGYHGLTFGSDGAFVRIPSQERVPNAVRPRR